MLYNDLFEWTVKHNVKSETESSFIEMLNNLMIDSPNKIKKHFGDAFNINLLKINCYKAALTVRFDLETNINYIAAYAKVEYDSKEMGVYKLIFNYNGEIEDDYWLSNDD